MAVRATNTLPAEAYSKAKELARNAKQKAQNARARLGNGVNAEYLLFRLLPSLKQMHDELGGYASVPGITAYARDQEQDVGYDPVAEFQAFQAAITDAVNLLLAFPQNSGWLSAVSFVGEVATWRTFTTAQLSALDSALQAIDDAVI